LAFLLPKAISVIYKRSRRSEGYRVWSMVAMELVFLLRPLASVMEAVVWAVAVPA
jgi:hypothetical protein